MFTYDFEERHVIGGFHMTNTAFLPTSLLKELSNTEDDFYNGHWTHQTQGSLQHGYVPYGFGAEQTVHTLLQRKLQE